MTIIILRIALLLIPLVAVIFWLRWRLKKDQTEEERRQDISRLQKTLGVLVIVALAAGVSLRLLDDRTGDARTRYIPPHSEDGKVVPGRFVSEDEEEAVDNSKEDDEGGEENPT
ncbi:hypothetical protein [Kordiimonas sp.]|uniref:hypothetical protein n=1 Tax=Kordiimonas sp. TaxID=1970157 RepID=UPI003A934586